MEVNCKINKEGIIEVKKQEEIIKMYKNLFCSMYGEDIVDSFLHTVKKAVPEINRKLTNLKHLSDNYQRAIQALQMVKDNDNLDLLEVYNAQSELIGVGRLRIISENVASVPDLIFKDKEIQKEVINQVLNFISAYFTNLGYERLELEIPFKDVIYLSRANSLGFHEDLEDINTGVRTYLLNKPLERNLVNEESTHSR